MLVLFGQDQRALQSQEHQIKVPLCVVDSFYLYGLAGNMFDHDNHSYPPGYIEEVWNAFSKIQSSDFHTTLLNESISDLKQAKTHTDFLTSLSFLSRLALNQDFANYLSQKDLVECFDRFYAVPPDSESDASVLLGITQFVLQLDAANDVVSNLLDKAWPLLLEIISSAYTHIITPELSVQFGEALCDWICRSTSSTLFKIAENGILDRLIDCIAEKIPRKTSLLAIFLPFTKLPTFMDYFDGHSSLDKLCLALIGFLTPRSRGNTSSDHQNQKDSYFSALIIRNILAISIESGQGLSSSLMAVDDFGWLKNLLNHDDDDFQIVGIGIGSNLVLSDAAFIGLCRAVPYFIDSSVQIITNTNEAPEKRKEALLLVGNFFHSLKLRSKSSPGDDGSSVHEWKRNGFHIVENIFGTLVELLESPYIPLRLSVSLLLYNLCCANKHFMRKLFKSTAIWTPLFNIYDPKVPVKSLDSLQKYCNLESTRTHGLCLDSSIENVIRICSILLEGNKEFALYLVEDTEFMDFVLFIIDYDFGFNAEMAHTSICGLLAVLIQQFNIQERKMFEKLLNPFPRIMWLALNSIQKSEFPNNSYGYTLLSQLLSWQLSVGGESIIKDCFLKDSVLANSLVKTLIDRVFHYSSDTLEVAASQNCLEFLIGTFDFAKEIALSSRMFLSIEKQLDILICARSEETKLDVIEIRPLISLIVKLCANNVTAKVIIVIFADI